MIVDAHNDLLLELAFRADEERPFATHWLPKLRSGGIGVQVCPIFVELEDLPELALAPLARASAGVPPRGTRVSERRGGRSVGRRSGLPQRPNRARARARRRRAAGLRPMGRGHLLGARRAHGVAHLESSQPVRGRPRRGLRRRSLRPRQRARPPARHAGSDPRPLARVRADLRPRARDRAGGDGRREPCELPGPRRHTAQPVGRPVARARGTRRRRRRARASFRRRGAHGRTPRRPRRPHRLPRRDRACRPGRGLHRPDRPLGGGHARAPRAAAGRNAARRLDRRARGSGGLPVARRGTSSPGLRGRPARRGPRRKLAAHTAKGLPG